MEVAVVVLIIHRVGAQPLPLRRHLPGGDLGNNGRVQPAAKKSAHRHITNQLALHRVRHQLMGALYGVRRAVRMGRGVQLPVPMHLQSAVVIGQVAGRRQLRQIPKHRVPRGAGRPQHKDLCQPAAIHHRLHLREQQQGRDPAGKGKQSSFFAVKQGLYPDPVPGSKQGAPAGVIHRKSKNAVELFQTPGFPLMIGLKHHFCITGGLKAVPGAFQQMAHFCCVVNFAIIGDH